MSSESGEHGNRGGGRRRKKRGRSSSDDLGGIGFGFGRRKHKGENEDNILGVFVEGEDSSGDEKGKGRRKGKAARKGAGQGLGGSVATGEALSSAFVKGDVLNKTHVPVAQKDESDDDATDARFKFDAKALGANNNAPEREQGPQLPAKNKMSLNQMSGTYGKGLAMLKKMGWTGGGMGKREDGIANPIEVTVRKGRQGVQDDGEMAEQDLYGREAVGSRRSVEELLSATAPKHGGPKAGEGWKKTAGDAKRPKTQYKTAAEIAASASSGVASYRITDMRGSQPRIVNSLAEIATSLSDSVHSLKEARYNSRLLVTRYEEKIRQLTEKKQYYQNLLLAAERNLDHLKATASMSSAEVGNCRKLGQTVEDLRIRQDDGSISVAQLGRSFVELRNTWPCEFKAMRVFEVAMAFVVPLAKREFESWQALEDPARGFDALAPWRTLAEGQPADAVQALYEGALLPRIRIALINWSPLDLEPCLRMMECCKNALSVTVAKDVAAQVVLPRLRRQVDDWNGADSLPIHVWVLPWLPILGSALDALWVPIRFKLTTWLNSWDTSDHSVLALLRPWHKVYDPANWEPLIAKVVSRLELAVSGMAVRPDCQELGPIKDLGAWIDLAEPGALAHVLDVAFFPNWHNALRAWLRSPECDYIEVLEWYQGWQALLPKALQEQPVVRRQFAAGLDRMMHVMSSGVDEPSLDS